MHNGHDVHSHRNKSEFLDLFFTILDGLVAAFYILLRMHLYFIYAQKF